MYDTSEIRKGLKVLMDGNPYTVIEFQFVKPGKGQAFTRTKFKNLLTGAVIERNLRSGEKLEPANVEENNMQFLYKEGDQFVFMDNASYEQYEIGPDQVDDAWKYLKEGMVCQVTLFNNNPIVVAPPNHVVLKVEYAEPAVRGNTATNLTKPVKLETGAEFIVPAFVEQGEMVRIDTRTGEYIERVRE